MGISLGGHWDEYLRDLVASGQYGSTQEALRDGLRLLLAEETKFTLLREKLVHAIALGGEHTDEDVEAAIEKRLASVENEAR